MSLLSLSLLLLSLLPPSTSLPYPFNYSLHIDCGGLVNTTDAFHTTWLSDRFFSGGATSVVSEPLSSHSINHKAYIHTCFHILKVKTLLLSLSVLHNNKTYHYRLQNDVAAVAMNGVEFVASWFTPTVLFCVMNLMIGTIFITSSLLRSHKSDQRNPADEQPPQLLRVPSLFERVKSFNLSRYRSDQPDPVHDIEPETEIEEPEAEEPHVTRTKSETVSKASLARVLKKSASEKVVVANKREEEAEERRRPATVREKTASYSEEDEAVDEKADDFINRFRQQLKLQRLDSILRYKEMLNRGIGR